MARYACLKFKFGGYTDSCCGVCQPASRDPAVLEALLQSNPLHPNKRPTVTDPESGRRHKKTLKAMRDEYTSAGCNPFGIVVFNNPEYKPLLEPFTIYQRAARDFLHQVSV